MDDTPQYILEEDRRAARDLEQAEWELDDTRVMPGRRAFVCDHIDESGGYEEDDPKHPTYHDRYAEFSDAA